MRGGKAVLPVTILAGAVIGGLYLGKLFIANTTLQLALANQKASITLPKPVDLKADVLSPLDITLNGKISTTVPIDQRVIVPVDDTLHVTATLDHDVPIRMTVPIRDTIPVDQTVHVDSKIGVEVMGRLLTLPIKGDIPVKTRIPVSLDVPVDQMVHLKFTAPADVKLLQSLNVPLKAEIRTTIPLHSDLSVPVKSALFARVSTPDAIDGMLTVPKLQIPLSTLGLHRSNREESNPKAAAAQP